MLEGSDFSQSMGLLKAGIDGLRNAIGLWKDIKSTLPKEKAAEYERLVSISEDQIKIAEAQIAKSLGFSICTCAFPPTPMLKIGYRRSMHEPGRQGYRAYVDVHECPKCLQTDAGGFPVDRKVPQKLDGGI